MSIKLRQTARWHVGPEGTVGEMLAEKRAAYNMLSVDCGPLDVVVDEECPRFGSGRNGIMRVFSRAEWHELQTRKDAWRFEMVNLTHG